jgi:hypothetical protein
VRFCCARGHSKRSKNTAVQLAAAKNISQYLSGTQHLADIFLNYLGGGLINVH